MRILCPRKSSHVYSANSYLVLGDWNRLEDVNALIDAGPNPYLVAEIETASTGFGKVAVDCLVMTHGHSDHSAGAPELKARYAAVAYAFAPFEGVDRLLADGETLRLGDRDFEVIHAPVHSSDSICLFNEDEGVLFSGDTPLRILSPEGSHDEAFIALLERLLKLDVRAVYPGHDQVLVAGVAEMLRETLRNVECSITRDRSDRRFLAGATWSPTLAEC